MKETDIAASTPYIENILTILGLAHAQKKTIVTADVSVAFLHAKRSSEGKQVYGIIDAQTTKVLIKKC